MDLHRLLTYVSDSFGKDLALCPIQNGQILCGRIFTSSVIQPTIWGLVPSDKTYLGPRDAGFLVSCQQRGDSVDLT